MDEHLFKISVILRLHKHLQPPNGDGCHLWTGHCKSDKNHSFYCHNPEALNAILKLLNGKFWSNYRYLALI